MDYPNLKKENFCYFIKHVWPEHEHFNNGIKLVFQCDRKHENTRATYTKILFLDKVYSAGLRRWFLRCPQGGQLSGCQEINEREKCKCDPVEIFIKHMKVEDETSAFIKVMENSLKLGKTLNDENKQGVVRCQTDFSAALIDRIRTTPKQNQKPNFQSFCSKYLWFHAGIFPIFDRNARIGLKRLQNRSAVFCDNYADLVTQEMALMVEIFNTKKFSSLQIKQIDGYLFWIGRDRRNMKLH